jgi:hypothetical protein
LKLFFYNFINFRCLGSLTRDGLHQRTAVHDALIRFEALVMLEFELSTWVPLPSGALQRTLVTELHMFCPSLRSVSLWISSRRFVWRYDAEVDVWAGQVDQRGNSGWKSV